MFKVRQKVRHNCGGKAVGGVDDMSTDGAFRNKVATRQFKNERLVMSGDRTGCENASNALRHLGGGVCRKTATWTVESDVLQLWPAAGLVA